MKKILTLALGVCLLGGAMVAQDTGGDKNQKGKNTAKPAAHKGGKKSKKGSGGSTTPPPK